MAGRPQARADAAALARGEVLPEKPRSSGHPVGCKCARCVGFQNGNRHTVLHGAFAPDLYAQESAYLAERIEESLGEMVGPLDEFAVRLCAVALARAEYAARYMERRRGELEESGASLSVEEFEELERLGSYAIRWMGQARRWMGDLGMTPAARAKLLRDAGVGRAAVVRADAGLREYLERRPPSSVVEGEAVDLGDEDLPPAVDSGS